MIAIDTKVVVRLLTADDLSQYRQALKLFKQHDVFICDTVVLECEWVLRYAYDYAAADIDCAFEQMFGLPNVHLSNPNTIATAILWHQQGMDFADALHLSLSHQHDAFYTFDKAFEHKAKALSGCVVCHS